MLKEKVLYKEGLPVNCYVMYIDDYPIHFHDDLEVAFVLEGSVILKNGYYTYTMNKGDTFILNDREIHSYYNTGEPNAVMILQIDLTYFGKYYANLKNSFFVTDMKDAEDESLEQLRAILARIILEFISAEPGYERKVIESTHSMIDHLIMDFQYFAMEDGKFINKSGNKGNKILAERMNRITDYMYDNYTRRLTLNEIAEREHLSIFYLSHVIKEAAGLNFQELLSFIRVEESEKLLLGTNKKIGVISMESGFSAVRYYIKFFIKWFGMHPSEYREKYTGHVRSREVSARLIPIPSDHVIKMIREEAKDVYEGIIGNRAIVVTAEVNVKVPADDRKIWNNSLADLLREESLKPAAELFELLLELNEEQIAAHPNYIITRAAAHKENLAEGHYSILFYNFDEKLLSQTYKGTSLKKLRDVVCRYQGELEILIKLFGLSGEYRIARYRLPRESILSSYQAALGEQESTGIRERLINRWAGTPVVSIEAQYVTEGLNVQSCLSGFSAELVLIDRV